MPGTAKNYQTNIAIKFQNEAAIISRNGKKFAIFWPKNELCLHVNAACKLAGLPVVEIERPASSYPNQGTSINSYRKPFVSSYTQNNTSTKMTPNHRRWLAGQPSLWSFWKSLPWKKTLELHIYQCWQVSNAVAKETMRNYTYSDESADHTNSNAWPNDLLRKLNAVWMMYSPSPHTTTNLSCNNKHIHQGSRPSTKTPTCH